MFVTDEYEYWNHKILEYCLEISTERNEAGASFFTLAIHELLEDQPDGQAARENFINAVRTQYLTCLKLAPAGFGGTWTDDALQALSSMETPQAAVPPYTAFLALSVLAAEDMDDNGYYRHLRNYLDEQPAHHSIYPRGFQTHSFEACWTHFQSWLASTHSMKIHGREGKEHRYITWPMKHVLLRRVDLQKLRNFFVYWDYVPGEPFNFNDLEYRFDYWLNTAECSLTKSGRNVWLKAASRYSVLQQIGDCLENWDGGALIRRRSPADETSASELKFTHAWLEIHDTKTIIFCVKDPDEQLAKQDFHETKWKRMDDFSYLLLLPNSKVAAILSSDIPQETFSQPVTFTAKPFYAFVQSAYGQWLDWQKNDELELGLTCAILCRSSLRNAVRRYLEDICERENLIEQAWGDSWVLFPEFNPLAMRTPPPEIISIRIRQHIRATFVGGLRCGRSNVWLLGAPPQRLEIQNYIGNNVWVNGHPLAVINHAVNLSDTLCQEGRYVFDWHQSSASIELIDGGVANEALGFQIQESASLIVEQSEHHPIPPGRWTLIGERPDEVALIANSTRGNPSGRWQWAVGYYEHQGPTVICINPGLSRPKSASYRVAHRLWADAILHAQRPIFGSTSENVNLQSVARLWSDYISAARSIKSKRLFLMTSFNI